MASVGNGKLAKIPAASLAVVAVVTAVISFSVAFFSASICRRKSKILSLRVKELEASLEMAASERRGRIRAQQALRLALAQRSSDGLEISRSESAASYPMAPIAFVQSCFTARNGTPRQPLVVPLSRACLMFDSSRVPAAALDGLAEYSHCWVLYVFHLNTDLEKLWKQTSRSKFKAKVRVPRLKGGKMGVLATRSPHRPCPIGLSVAKGWTRRLTLLRRGFRPWHLSQLVRSVLAEPVMLPRGGLSTSVPLLGNFRSPGAQTLWSTGRRDFRTSCRFLWTRTARSCLVSLPGLLQRPSRTSSVYPRTHTRLLRSWRLQVPVSCPGETQPTLPVRLLHQWTLLPTLRALPQIEAHEGHAILLSGVDMVDGTPVLDVKPYLPYSDSIQGATLPKWLKEEENSLAVSSVCFSAEFSSTLSRCWSEHEKKSLYASMDEFQSLIKEVLSWDIRSLSQRSRPHHATIEDESHECSLLPADGGDKPDGVTYHLILEGVDISYRIDEVGSNILVEKATLVPSAIAVSKYHYNYSVWREKLVKRNDFAVQ